MGPNTSNSEGVVGATTTAAATAADGGNDTTQQQQSNQPVVPAAATATTSPAANNNTTTTNTTNNATTTTAAAPSPGTTATDAQLANLTRPYTMTDRTRTQPSFPDQFQPSVVQLDDSTGTGGNNNNNNNRGRERQRDTSEELPTPARCINPASEVNSRLDTQVEVRVYPCNNSQTSGKKKFTTFTIKPEVS